MSEPAPGQSGTVRPNEAAPETRTASPEDESAHPGDELLVARDSDVRPTLSVVMPTLNEEGGVAECITRIKNALVALDVTGEILISDSSDDRTPEIAASMGARVVTPDGPGYGYAYQYAFERARGEYIAIGDADTTYDFEELPKLFERVAYGDADMAMGSRLEGEIRAGSMPALHQYIGNPLLTRFLNVFYDAGVSDAHSGMRVISRDALEQLDCSTTGMEYASEMIMEAGAAGMKIEEEPIVYHEREGEATLESFRDGWRHVRFMLVNAPAYLFSLPGLALSGFGVLLMALVLTNANINGMSPGVRTMIAGGLCTITGYQIVTLGIFATVTSDPINDATDIVSRTIRDHLKLEYGTTIGLGLFAAGSAYVLYLLYTWITSGFAELPTLMYDIAAFTAIVLGLQTVFSAFFMSIIAESEDI